MATFTKRLLSGSTDGRQINILATATPGTTVHTSVAGTTDFDEIFLYANNTDTVDRKLTIEWGGALSPDNLIEVVIPGESGLVLVVPGAILQNAKVVKAFAETTAVINILGWVNRIS